ncbi:MAG: histidine phosphatase family protein [Chthonomonas sp.]|nr:histidine phosphatase family protein [Chthonomonas sp.]
MQVYLIRHGQTEWNRLGKAQGHTDIDLDETGQRQVSELETAFAGRPLGQVWSSDLVRATSTAAALTRATGAALTTDAALRERAFGEWEGFAYNDVHTRLREASAEVDISEFHARPPGGESVLDVWHRVESIVARLREAEQPIAIVSHGGVCAQLLAQLLRGTMESTRSFRFENTAITELVRRPDGFFRLVRFGCTAHLSEPSAPMIDAHNLQIR